MKKTLLLVEDSKVQKLATGRVLLRAGYLVLYACDGEEALVWPGRAFLTWFCWTCYYLGSEEKRCCAPLNEIRTLSRFR
jgi:hypothetical protein